MTKLSFKNWLNVTLGKAPAAPQDEFYQILSRIEILSDRKPNWVGISVSLASSCAALALLFFLVQQNQPVPDLFGPAIIYSRSSTGAGIFEDLIKSAEHF